jgi:hypothetical protein
VAVGAARRRPVAGRLPAYLLGSIATDMHVMQLSKGPAARPVGQRFSGGALPARLPSLRQQPARLGPCRVVSQPKVGEGTVRSAIEASVVGSQPLDRRTTHANSARRMRTAARRRCRMRECRAIRGAGGADVNTAARRALCSQPQQAFVLGGAADGGGGAVPIGEGRRAGTAPAAPAAADKPFEPLTSMCAGSTGGYCADLGSRAVAAAAPPRPALTHPPKRAPTQLGAQRGAPRRHARAAGPPPPGQPRLHVRPAPLRHPGLRRGAEGPGPRAWGAGGWSQPRVRRNAAMHWDCNPRFSRVPHRV